MRIFLKVGSPSGDGRGDLLARPPARPAASRQHDIPLDGKAAAAPDFRYIPFDRGAAPLAPSVRSFMEPRFGHDLSQVRVHADEAADGAARGLEARAFTVGNDVFFGRGEYQPSSPGGRALLAHELSHVVQQRGEAPPPGVSQEGDPHERRADAAAERVARGDHAGPGLTAEGRSAPSSATSLQRKVAVDPAKFATTTARTDFKNFLLDELKTVTGLDLSFSGDSLVDAGTPPKGGSATAAKVLQLALKDTVTLYFDPKDPAQKNLGAGYQSGRGVWVDSAKLPVQLKAFRPGILIIHELTHLYASALKPANYDKDMKALVAKGAAATPDEQDLAAHYQPGKPEGDENIAVGIESKVQGELGLAQRTHYEVPIEYPAGKMMTVGQFKKGSTFIYLDFKTYDLYTSSKDLFAELAKLGKPPPPGADFKKLVKGTPEYTALKSEIL